MNRKALLALAGAAAGGGLAPRFALAAEKMRLAAPALDATALMFYATEQGFLKTAGLDTDIEAMRNGEAVTVALSGGAVDVGCSEVVSLILAFRKGIPITLIAGGGMQTPKNATGILFARRDAGIANGRDFNGKTVAVVGLNGFAQYGTQNWIDKNGGDSKSVKFLQLAGAQIPVALQDGRIDAAFVPEPFVAPTKKVATPLADSMSAVAPQFLSSAHFTTLPYARAHAEEIKRLQGALRQAADWANKNHERTALILQKVARVSPEVLAASSRAVYAQTLDPGDVQPLIDVAARYGGFPSFSASEMIFRA